MAGGGVGGEEADPAAFLYISYAKFRHAGCY